MTPGLGTGGGRERGERLGHEDRGMSDDFTPGQRVRHPGQPDWGLGQVQSAVGRRVTVNFENAGKVLINTAHVTLEIVEEGRE